MYEMHRVHSPFSMFALPSVLPQCNLPGVSWCWLDRPPGAYSLCYVHAIDSLAFGLWWPRSWNVGLRNWRDLLGAFGLVANNLRPCELLEGPTRKGHRQAPNNLRFWPCIKSGVPTRHLRQPRTGQRSTVVAH